jgi:NAD(P)-dependent dehydrogenase (short-subunit alcohol dehydrogenase family)
MADQLTLNGRAAIVTGAGNGLGRAEALALSRAGALLVLNDLPGDAIADTAEQVRAAGSQAVVCDGDIGDWGTGQRLVSAALDAYGRLDVVVNNAGYGHFGMVEEISEAEIRAQLETNVLGALWVTQAALPFLREQGSGHIIQVSSIGGVSAFMNTGAYHASKWALEGFSQSVAQEVAGFGIKVTLVEPSGYSTDWAGSSAVRSTPIPAYDAAREAAARSRAQRFTEPGNPVATRDAILTLVDSDNPPLRLFLGESPLRIAVADYGSRLTTWAQWQQVAAAAQGTQG